jgi:2-dehydropantoate 2-reductase
MDQTSTNIVIIGQGAIGLLWYHHLSQVNNPLHVSLRVNLLASNQGQLSLAQQSNAQYQFTPYQQASAQSYPLSYAQADDIKQADIILLCIKSFQVANALEKISTDISPSCMVILAHNGMGTLEQVKKYLTRRASDLCYVDHPWLFTQCTINYYSYWQRTQRHRYHLGKSNFTATN